MNPRAIRALRAAIAAGVATHVALLSHVIGGGSAPDPLLVALVVTVSWIVCLALVGTRLSTARIAAAVTLSQVAFHATFAALGGASSANGVVGHVHGGAYALPSADAALTSTPALLSADPLMWLAHGFAAALTTIALVHGERAVRAIAAPLVEFVRLIAAAFVTVPVAVGPRVRIPLVRHPVAGLLSRLATASLSRRGPPALLLASH